MPSEPELLRATQEAWTRAQRALPAARPLWWWKAAGWPGTEEAQAAADALAAAVEAVLQSAAEETNLSTVRSCLLEAGDMVAALFGRAMPFDPHRWLGLLTALVEALLSADEPAQLSTKGYELLQRTCRSVLEALSFPEWRGAPSADVATDPRLATQRREPAPEQRRQERWTAWASLVDRALTAGAHVQVARHAVRHAVLLRLAELLVLAITEPDVDGGTRSFTARDLSRSASWLAQDERVTGAWVDRAMQVLTVDAQTTGYVPLLVAADALAAIGRRRAELLPRALTPLLELALGDYDMLQRISQRQSVAMNLKSLLLSVLRRPHSVHFRDELVATLEVLGAGDQAEAAAAAADQAAAEMRLEGGLMAPWSRAAPQTPTQQQLEDAERVAELLTSITASRPQAVADFALDTFAQLPASVPLEMLQDDEAARMDPRLRARLSTASAAAAAKQEMQQRLKQRLVEEAKRRRPTIRAQAPPVLPPHFTAEMFAACGTRAFLRLLHAEEPLANEGAAEMRTALLAYLLVHTAYRRSMAGTVMDYIVKDFGRRYDLAATWLMRLAAAAWLMEEAEAEAQRAGDELVKAEGKRVHKADPSERPAKRRRMPVKTETPPASWPDAVKEEAAVEPSLTQAKARKMTVAQLREELMRRGLDKSGLKAVLLERLLRALESEAAPKPQTPTESSSEKEVEEAEAASGDEEEDTEVGGDGSVFGDPGDDSHALLQEYERLVLAFVDRCEALRDARAAVLPAFLLQLPLLPESVFEALYRVGQDPTRASTAIMALRELLLHRYGAARDRALHTAFRLVQDDDELVRGPAVRMLADKVHAEHAQLAPVVEAAVQERVRHALREMAVTRLERLLVLLAALARRHAQLLTFLVLEVYVATAAEAMRAVVQRVLKQTSGLVSVQDAALTRLVRDAPVPDADPIIRVLVEAAAGSATKLPSELVDACRARHQRTGDIHLLLPILNGFSSGEAQQVLPLLVQHLSPAELRTAFHRLTAPSRTAPALPPAVLLQALHTLTPNAADGLSVKQLVRALQVCFDMPSVFRPEVWAAALPPLAERDPLPLLLLRSVLQLLALYPQLQAKVLLPLLARLARRRIWQAPKLWEGFLRAVTLTLPQSLPAVLRHLPNAPLERALQDYPPLQQALRECVRSMEKHGDEVPVDERIRRLVDTP
ncbi:hypothetical protein CDCA_CDCA06G1992 [Cyanidium caldarium]|uniref:SAP domain-containing protein n=1 Tax=Cyanidium caldarium TaxID=2771 RepID=A0AAV9IUF8_CYACA|nr:hypothetical protein CDCA_CDCA06G1992 [Cyanidium caldarium]